MLLHAAWEIACCKPTSQQKLFSIKLQKKSSPPVYHPNFLNFLRIKVRYSCLHTPRQLTPIFSSFQGSSQKCNVSTLLHHPRPWESLPHVHQLLCRFQHRVIPRWLASKDVESQTMPPSIHRAPKNALCYNVPYLAVSKNKGVSPKMDGLEIMENPINPKWDDLGGLNYHHFREETPYRYRYGYPFFHYMSRAAASKEFMAVGGLPLKIDIHLGRLTFCT